MGGKKNELNLLEDEWISKP